MFVNSIGALAASDTMWEGKKEHVPLRVTVLLPFRRRLFKKMTRTSWLGCWYSSSVRSPSCRVMLGSTVVGTNEETMIPYRLPWRVSKQAWTTRLSPSLLTKISQSLRLPQITWHANADHSIERPFLCHVVYLNV
jgi:hypothetical protein